MPRIIINLDPGENTQEWLDEVTEAYGEVIGVSSITTDADDIDYADA